MGRERGNVQPALSKPQRGRRPLDTGKRSMDALIVVLHHDWQLHNTKECLMDDYKTWLVMKQTGLKPAAKMVLYWIAEAYDETTDECVVGINRLAQLCEISRKCVQTHLTHLKNQGLISVNTRHHVSRAQDVNAYKLGLGQ